MLPRGTEVLIDEARVWRRVPVESLANHQHVFLLADRDSDGVRANASVSYEPRAGTVVDVTLTDGQSFRCSSDAVVLGCGLRSMRLADLKAGDELYPLGKWAKGFTPPPSKVVATVQPAAENDEWYAVATTGPRRHYAIAAGVFLAADKE